MTLVDHLKLSVCVITKKTEKKIIWIYNNRRIKANDAIKMADVITVMADEWQ